MIERKECKECGEMFVSGLKRKIYCSIGCRLKANAKRGNLYMKELRIIAKEKRLCTSCLKREVISGWCSECGSTKNSIQLEGGVKN